MSSRSSLWVTRAYLSLAKTWHRHGSITHDAAFGNEIREKLYKSQKTVNIYLREKVDDCHHYWPNVAPLLPCAAQSQNGKTKVEALHVSRSMNSNQFTVSSLQRFVTKLTQLDMGITGQGQLVINTRANECESKLHRRDLFFQTCFLCGINALIGFPFLSVRHGPKRPKIFMRP
jgi:hypothetical protein